LNLYEWQIFTTWTKDATAKSIIHNSNYLLSDFDGVLSDDQYQNNGDVFIVNGMGLCGLQVFYYKI